MLIPNVDHLFDRGFISQENNGTLLISTVADTYVTSKLGIDVSVAPTWAHFQSRVLVSLSTGYIDTTLITVNSISRVVFAGLSFS